MTDQNKWLPMFEEVSSYARIDSKEVASLDDRGAPLNMWASQEMVLLELARGLDAGQREFIFLKSRQLGVTTLLLLLIDVFWYAVHPGLIGALVVDTPKNANAFRATITRMVASFPKGYLGKFKIIRSHVGGIQYSNGSRLDILVAGTGKKSISWGEGQGYVCGHLSEVAAYGNPAGLESFLESLSAEHPDRLVVFESTAKGMNHFRDIWIDAGKDPTKRRFFIGWWAKPMNAIAKSDPRFAKYGAARIDADEREKINLVKERHGVTVTIEQVAWRRWKDSKEGADEGTLQQNQPWVEEDAWVLTGFSFFMTRVVQRDLERVYDPAQAPAYNGFRYYMGNDFFSVQTERISDPDRRDEVELKIWDEPIKGASYAIGCDPAFGRTDWGDRHCLDRDTEILTRDGWRNYSEIMIGDEAVCFDLDSEEYSFGAIIDVVVKNHAGPMYRFTSDGLDCLVTPEHRVVARYWAKLRSGDRSPWRIKTAVEAAESATKSTLTVPRGGAPFGPGIPDLSTDMCRALGWILTDGHLRKFSDNARPFIWIGQSIGTNRNGKNIVSEIDRVLPGLCEFSRSQYQHDGRSDSVFWRIGVDESQKFYRWLGDDMRQTPLKEFRYLPHDLIVGCNKEQLEALFLGLMEGDGNWDDASGKWIKFCPGQASQLADDFQEIAIRLGYSATKTIQKPGREQDRDQWLVRLSTRPHHCIREKESYEETYSGVVWCATVPTGAFVARRNGKVFVTGNCVSVWRCFSDRLVQVAEYCSNDVETRQCAWVLAHLAGAYGDCLVNLELTGPGRAVMVEFDSLRDRLRAEHMQKEVEDRKIEDFLSNARWYMYSRPDTMGSGFMLNTEMNFKVKWQTLNSLRDNYQMGLLDISSARLLEEMLIVTQEGNDIGAPGRGHDDRVFAMNLANESWNRWIRPRMNAENMTYENTMAMERGEINPIAAVTNRIVANFMRRQEELAEMEPEAPQWLRDRGLA